MASSCTDNCTAIAGGAQPPYQAHRERPDAGWRTHELVILPLGAAAPAGHLRAGPDGKVQESTSVGEASKSCQAGSGEGIKAGAVGWTTLTLVAGRYELICNLPNHYANGMHQLLVVT